MKGLFIALVIGLFVIGCSDEDHQLPIIKPDFRGIFTDADGNEFEYVRYGHLEWMTTNLNLGDYGETYGIEVSREDSRNPIDLELEKEQNLATFGCLYTYEEAVKAVPEGWRLPTDEDWKVLEKAMGMSDKAVNALDWRGTDAGTLLQQKEGTGINLRTGGMGEYDGYGKFKPYFINVYGFYWTATDTITGQNYCRQISYNSGKIARVSINRSKMLSVRCVRDLNAE